MIVAEVSRHEQSKVGEPEVERNPNPLPQTINSRVLTSGAVFKLCPRTSEPRREACRRGP